MTHPTTDQPSGQLQGRIYEYLTAAAVTVIGAGTIIYRLLEDWSWVDSFYFSVVAITTVGFGDIAPETDGGKLFTIPYILVGISIIATFLDARMKRHAVRRIGAPTD